MAINLRLSSGVGSPVAMVRFPFFVMDHAGAKPEKAYSASSSAGSTPGLQSGWWSQMLELVPLAMDCRLHFFPLSFYCSQARNLSSW